MGVSAGEVETSGSSLDGATVLRRDSVVEARTRIAMALAVAPLHLEPSQPFELRCMQLTRDAFADQRMFTVTW
jgi:hypothetical protein